MSGPPIRIFLLALGIGILSWSPTTASAQAPADSSSEQAEKKRLETANDAETGTQGYETASVGHEDFLSDSHRRELYEKGRLKYSRAALWTALLPGLGNFYAEQYFLGGLNMSTVGFSAVLIPYGFVTDQDGFIWAGLGLIGVGYISGFATSYMGVRTYNRRLRQQLRVSERQSSPRPDALTDSPWAPPEFERLTIEFRFR